MAAHLLWTHREAQNSAACWPAEPCACPRTTPSTLRSPHRLEDYGIKYGYSPVLLAHPDALT